MTRLRETTGVRAPSVRQLFETHLFRGYQAMSDSHKALAIELENLFVLHRSGLVLEQGPAIPLICASNGPADDKGSLTVCTSYFQA